MFYIVDRIEGSIIVVEDQDGNIVNLNKNKVNGQIKEGDCLREENKKFFLDIEKTKEREIKIEKVMKGSWED